MAQLIPVDHDPFAGIDESRAPFGAMSPSEIPQGSLQGRVLQSLTTDMAAAPINAIQQFMDTGSPESSFNVATTLAGGGIAGAERGAAGALGGRLVRDVTVRGRGGRPLYSELMPGNPEGMIASAAEVQGLQGAGELHVLHDANGQIQGLYGSKSDAAAARDARMKQHWNEGGPTYGDEYGGAPPNEWNRVIRQWNKENPDQRVDPNHEGTWYSGSEISGRNYSGTVLEGKPELQSRLENVDKQWMDRPKRYPGAAAAARYFEEGGDEEDLGKVLSIRKGTHPSMPKFITVDHDPFAVGQ